MALLGAAAREIGYVIKNNTLSAVVRVFSPALGPMCTSFCVKVPRLIHTVNKEWPARRALGLSPALHTLGTSRVRRCLRLCALRMFGVSRVIHNANKDLRRAVASALQTPRVCLPPLAFGGCVARDG